jgi:hypothetical protein
VEEDAMKRRTALRGLVLLGVGLAGAACSSGDSEALGGRDTSGQESPPVTSSNPGSIDIANDSQLSLGLRGGLGPVLEGGQTLTKAVVTLDSVQLVNDRGAAVPLLEGSVTADLLALQDSLKQLVPQRAVDAGKFTDVRFRVTAGWIETADAQDVSHVFASDRVDLSQFSSAGSVGPLEISGLDSDGFVSVAIPQDGIAIQGVAALALHFALAESLSVQRGDVWVLAPRVWIFDQSVLSSLDVELDVASESDARFFTQGFQVMLLDANLRPVSRAPLVAQSTTVVVANFQVVEFFQGPLVAVLVPPSGVSLQSAVAVSIDVQRRASARASFAVTSVQRVSGTARGTFDMRTDSHATVTQRGLGGEILGQTRAPVGAIAQVAPHRRPAEPLRPGERPAATVEPPRLPGLPPPVDGGSERPPADAGRRPAIADAGASRPQPRTDASRPSIVDAAVPRPRPPRPHVRVVDDPD